MPYSPFNTFYLLNSFFLPLDHEITAPQIGLIAGTRTMLGAGIGMSFSEKLTGEQRRAIGWPLVAIGALGTIPLAL